MLWKAEMKSRLTYRWLNTNLTQPPQPCPLSLGVLFLGRLFIEREQKVTA